MAGGNGAGFALPGIYLGDLVQRRQLMAYLNLLNAAGGDYFLLPSGGVIDGYATENGVATKTTGSYGTKKYISQPALSTVLNQSLGSNTTGQNYTIRNVFSTSLIGATGSKVRITFRSSSTTAGTISAAYIGHAAGSGDAYDFAATPTQITFDSGNASSGVIAANTTKVSDDITFTLNNTSPLIISLIYSASGDGAASNSLTNCNLYYKTGSDAATVNATGYTLASNLVQSVTKIEVVGDYSLSVVSNVFAVAAAPAQLFVGGIAEWSGSLTLGTDLTLEASRNNKTTYTAVPLTNYGVVNGNKRFVGGVVNVSGQSSGTQLAYRWTQVNNKLVSLYGTALEL